MVKSIKLGDICEITSSKRIFMSDYVSFGIPFYRSKEIIERQRGKNISTELFISEEKYEEIKNKYSVPQANDILLTSVGTLGIPYVVKKDEKFYFKDGNLIWIKKSSNIYSHFLYYFFISKEGKSKLENISIGTTQRALTIVGLKNLTIDIPSLNTQKQIASVLSTLDAKIELNNAINNNLEQQAQILFKSWFVDFEPFGGKMPKNWKEYKLDDLTSKFGTGLNPRKNFVLGHGNNYYVTIKNMANNRIYLDDRCDKIDDEAILKINKRSKLQRGDLLFSGIGTIGRVALITENPTNWNTSESVFNMHPCENISSEFLYVLLLSEQFQSYVNVHKQGGVQQGIRMASLKDFKISLPSYNVIHSFDNLIVPMISTIKNKEKENDNLAQLRDTLLPKLMSGEIDVSKVNIDNLSSVDELTFTKG